MGKALKNITTTDIFNQEHRINCGCGDEDCVLIVKTTKSNSCVSINFHKRICFTDYSNTKSFIGRMFNRLKYSMIILFKGYLELEESFMITDEKAISNIIDILSESKREMKRVKELWDSKIN